MHEEDMGVEKQSELGFQLYGIYVVGTSTSLLSSSFPISKVGPVTPTAQLEVGLTLCGTPQALLTELECHSSQSF